ERQDRPRQYAVRAPHRGALPSLRRPPGPRVRRWPPADRPALLHELRRPEVCEEAVKDLRFAICDLRFAICDLRFAICDLRFAICDLRFPNPKTMIPGAHA